MTDYQFSNLSISSLPAHLETAFEYWHTIKGKRIAPTWPEFDMMEIPPSLLPFTMIKDVENNPRAYRYRFYGTALAGLYSSDMTHQTVDDLENSDFGKIIHQSLDDFTANIEPKYYRVHTHSKFGREVVHVLLRLPLSADQSTVTHIVSIIADHMDKDDFHKITD